MWKLSMNEILDYLATQEDKFSTKETKNLQIIPEAWKDKYLFFDFYEVYFVEFPIFLFEWLQRQT